MEAGRPSFGVAVAKRCPTEPAGVLRRDPAIVHIVARTGH